MVTNPKELAEDDEEGEGEDGEDGEDGMEVGGEEKIKVR